MSGFFMSLTLHCQHSYARLRQLVFFFFFIGRCSTNTEYCDIFGILTIASSVSFSGAQLSAFTGTPYATLHFAGEF